LAYHGVIQREHQKQLLKGMCSPVLLSTGPEIEPHEECFPDLPEYQGFGPLSGLLTAHHYFPNKDIFLLGCDYPIVRRQDLAFLLEKREPGIEAICYQNQDGFAEPLIAWYSAAFCKKAKRAWQD